MAEEVLNTQNNKKPQLQVQVKKPGIFKILKSRYFVFVFLTVVIIASAFCLFMLDSTNTFRAKYLPEFNEWCLETDFLRKFFDFFGVKDEPGKPAGVRITTWIFFTLGFGIVYSGFIVWCFFAPIKKKVVYNEKYNKYVIDKRSTVYNVIFFGLVGLLVAGLGFMVYKLFPWNKLPKGWLNWSNFINFLHCFGILMLLFSIPIVALLLVMLIFKLLVMIFVFFAGSVSKGVMKTQGYQEALATSQIVNARLQKEALKELDKDAPVVVTSDASGHVEDMVSSGDYGRYKSNPKYVSLDTLGKLGELQTKPAPMPDVIFPALTVIDNKYKGKSVPNENPKKLSITKSKTKDGKLVKITPQNDPNNLIRDFAPRFQAYLANKNDLYFSLEIIRAFVAGLNASRMILLEGLSGTGKTTLPRVFNEFVGGKSAFFPVQATWRDRSDIVGYYSDFTKQFKETEFLKAMYEASYTTNKFNIMVLDEMNISRVEYYFADFLSVLEYPKEEWLIPLINTTDQSKMPKHIINGKIRIPLNTWFVGTINVDDSTFTVSDKVYDRVIVIDFKELAMPFTSKVDDSKWNMTPQELLGVFNYITTSDVYRLTNNDKIKFIKLCEYTSEVFDIQFGNRVMNQIYSFVPVYVALGGSKEEALDFMFARKVLRKIDGKYETYISAGLTKLSKYLQTSYGKNHFKETENYIEKLRKKLM